MPAAFLPRLTAPERTRRAHWPLGCVLARVRVRVAGAVNAGGFLAVRVCRARRRP